ncbi:Phosphosugar isomerase [Nostocoides japonicum T1-X7]|uniref:Phosphosugar isomerase n=1 Tax=Nostocoides japonicum T1-X7 TaxID=1194083 RepID=A0A077M351_9MICO|nr:SIS domain-containing protein [Tetrasphaera japonica]CCH78619.1 Phosphosugar isomerase [Tetrasphaera japonica T1-X7]
MPQLDAERHHRTQSGAVGLGHRLDEVVADLVEAGLDHVVFGGTGGAGILMTPAADLLRDRGRLRVSLLRPAEMVAELPRSIGAGTVVVLPSLSGTTPESLEVTPLVQAAGATVVALVGDGSSPLATMADVVLVNPAADDTSSESFYLQSLLFTLAVLRHTGDATESDDSLLADLSRLPDGLLAAKQAYEHRAGEAARFLADGGPHIITGAGPAWAEAWYYGMCILEEMQWIPTRPVHASDFFHGTLELVEPGVSVVILAGEGPTRALTDRVEKFVRQITDRILVVDSTDAALPGVSAAARGQVSPIVLAALLERVSAHLEALRHHPLTTRRYYRRMEY